MENEPVAAPGPATIKAVAGLYNVVKLWARLPEDEARQKLSEALARPELANAKNNKGSTGLHAAGYLRRWDLAKIMIEAGADPLIKNLAGHDFYTLLVTAPRSPWRELLASHPDLIARQEAFLEERKRPAQAAKEKQGKKADKSEKRPGVDSKGGDRKGKKQEKFKRKAEASLDAEAIEKLRDLQIIGLDGALVSHGQAWEEAAQSAREGRMEACLAWLKSGQLHPGYDPEGLTLGQVIVALGDREALGAALNAGLSPKTPNREGETPLHTACKERRPDLAQALLTAGAEPAHRSEAGETALSIACLHNDVDMAERLLAFGASPSERLNSGEPLVDAAERLGHFEIADILSAELEHQPLKPLSVPGASALDEDDEANDFNGNTLAGPKSSGPKKKGGKKPAQQGPRAGGAKAKGSASKQGHPGAGKKRSGAKRASPMIAKLDGPVKEVDEFARYHSAKSAAPAPVIIVKKSRLQRPLPAFDQEPEAPDQAPLQKRGPKP